MPENMDVFEKIRTLKNTKQMQRQFVAKTWLTTGDWSRLFPRFVDHLVAAGGGVPTTEEGPMKFGDSLLWTRLTGRDLFIQVLAYDTLTLVGLQVMVEVYLREISEHRPFDLHWHPQPAVLAFRRPIQNDGYS